MMKLPSATALFILGASALTSCKEDTTSKNDVSEPLTAQELARILEVHAWKIKIKEFPEGAERLQMVVMDKEGRVLDRSAMFELNGSYKTKLPTEMLVGIEMKNGDAHIFMALNGSGLRATFRDPLNANEKTPEGRAKGWSKSDGAHWDGKFLQLLSNSASVGAGPKPFPEATRIVALHFCTEAESNQISAGAPDGGQVP